MVAPAVVILTGAGVSADSGVRTFRDAGGLWEGHRVEDVATPDGWARDPALVWRFYQQRRAQLRDVAPNAAHRALAGFAAAAQKAGVECTLVTQNVDDLHQRAGSDVLAMHGELLRLRCEACGVVAVDRERLDPARFASCGACGHPRLRPHIVWFGEVPFHLDAIERALRRCTCFVAIGTSGQVWPAAGMLAQARAQGAATWVQALAAPANLDARDHWRPGRAADVAPALLAEIARQTGVCWPS
ncbi:MAG: NAD-dependent deacylase [Planctomycetes bacterium]|nr:NAD-dependent deacylase [Planctomycetota bacterium]